MIRPNNLTHQVGGRVGKGSRLTAQKSMGINLKGAGVFNEADSFRC